MTEEINETRQTAVRKRGLRRSGAFKAFMVLTGTLAVLGAVGGCMLTVLLAENNIYTQSQETIGRTSLEDRCRGNIFEVHEQWQGIKNCMDNPDFTPKEYIEQQKQQLREQYDPDVSNFEFVICDAQGESVFECFTNDSYQYTWTEPFYSTTYETTKQRMTEEEWIAFVPPVGADISTEEIWLTQPITPETSHVPEPTITESEIQPDGVMEETTPPYPEDSPTAEAVYQEVPYYDVTISFPHTELTHSITGYVREELTADDLYAQSDRFFLLAYQYRYAPPVVLGVSILVFLFSLGILLWAAGWHRDSEAPSGGVFEKIPYDVFTFVLGCAGALGMVILDEFVNTFFGILMVGLVASGLTVLWLIVLWWLVSTAVRIRTKTILSHNLLVILWKRCANAGRRVLGRIEDVPLIGLAVLIAAGFFFLHLLGTVMLSGGNEFGLVLLILLYTAATIGICAVIANMHLLEKGASKIAGGDLDHKIPEEKLFGAFRKHGQHLNSIGNGMNLAVSERIKSERFKTELIANVSHDIRTPLTSIINYTDLLSKLELEDAQAQEYIGVLTRQSARLRKLTEDVLEASKATTGAMKVEKEKLDLRVLVEQILGEYTERLEAGSLQMVCTMAEEPLYIMADGRLLWRVMDNLFGNVCKYAMRGTRVYLDVAAADGKVILTMRNISAVQLHISADMLMERFVQGDRSRNTEGSGLGLSIAQSLTALQGGRMELHIDGDLFKAELVFPEAGF